MKFFPKSYNVEHCYYIQPIEQSDASIQYQAIPYNKILGLLEQLKSTAIENSSVQLISVSPDYCSYTPSIILFTILSSILIVGAVVLLCLDGIPFVFMSIFLFVCLVISLLILIILISLYINSYLNHINLLTGLFSSYNAYTQSFPNASNVEVERDIEIIKNKNNLVFRYQKTPHDYIFLYNFIPSILNKKQSTSSLSWYILLPTLTQDESFRSSFL